MDTVRKNAYRYLLYEAMLSIRPIAWLFTGRNRTWNPFQWRLKKKQIEFAGHLADWLHNLALYSAVDFQGFKEDLFWQDYERLRIRYPKNGLERYRERFDKSISEHSA